MSKCVSEKICDALLIKEQHIFTKNEVLACFGTIAVVTLTFSMVPVRHTPKENCSSFWQRPVALKRLEKTTSFYNPSYILCVGTYFVNCLIWGAIELTYLAFTEHVCALFKIVSSHLKGATNDYIMKQCDKANIYRRIIFAVSIHTRAIKLVVSTVDPVGGKNKLLVERNLKLLEATVNHAAAPSHAELLLFIQCYYLFKIAAKRKMGKRREGKCTDVHGGQLYFNRDTSWIASYPNESRLIRRIACSFNLYSPRSARCSYSYGTCRTGQY
ncbi:hypothetical protein WN51_05507 [Melipona quadrifasciata]|uniref:Uncharacterized protein n=1 Tax=Melipona quadrifasciata TaxID=166423 RepID=A0A0N0U7H1_9HYME|nr:hypothetical protein WN51_05507 [Melipona quadrifasciata]